MPLIDKNDLNIIVVDDSETYLKYISKILNKIYPDAEVQLFKSPIKALKFYSKKSSGIVITDMNMSEMTGIEFAKKIKRINPDEKIILMTSQSSKYFENIKDAECIEYFFPKLSSPENENMEFLLKFNISKSINSKRFIVEYRNLQSKLLQSEKMASIGTLAAGIAHEINNPMSYVKGNVSIILKYQKSITEFFKLISSENENMIKLKVLNDRMKNLEIDYFLEHLPNLVDATLEGIDRVIKIVKNLRDFSHKDKGIKERDNVNCILKNTVSMVWNELKYKVRVNNEFGDIPDIICYPQQLGQVFMNLLVNASHAIEQKGIISIKTYADRNNVIIKISDTGKGIPEEIKDRIFEPFFTTKEVGKGTGLGLSIVYDIIKKHKGTINVESEINKGTTFKIELPIEKKRILIVDDEKGIRKTLRFNLEREYLVKEAEDGFTAGRLIFEFKPDLVLLDIMMPGMNGIEVCKNIRKSKLYKDIKIFAVTASVKNDSELLNYGFDNIVRKPFDIDSFLVLIKKILNSL